MPYSCTSSVIDWSQKCDRSERKIGHAQPGAEVFVVVPSRGPNTGYSSGFAGYSRALRSCCLLTETGANAKFCFFVARIFEIEIASNEIGQDKLMRTEMKRNEQVILLT